MQTQRRQYPNSGRQGKTKACLYRQGMTVTIGVKMWGGARCKVGNRRLQKQNAEVRVVAYSSAGLS